MYGYIPYLGSKGRIAEKIVNALPAADSLVDIFAGGCSITTCASFSGKWNRILCNDIHASTIELFKDCLAGKLDGDVDWVSRKEFFERVDKEQYIASVWSFGNRVREGGYMYSKELEPLKEALHRHLQGDDTLYNQHLDFFKENPKFRLQHMERINQLRSIKVGDTPIEFSTKDYREVEIPDNSVIYCDPPYKNTKRYNKKDFDWDAFVDWAQRQTVPVYVSEYQCNAGKEVASFDKLCSVGAQKLQKVERLFLLN